MKSKLYIIASILAVLCLICSCAGGGSGSEEDAQKTVAVSFAVNTDSASRSISVDNPTITGLTYQYKATAKFTRSEFGAQGDTAEKWVDFETINTTTGTGSIGNFAQGRWEFEVRIIKEKTDNAGESLYNEADTTTYTLMYQTSEAFQEYLNATTTAAPIEVTVVRQIDKANNAQGTLSIASITAPTASATDKLVVTYGPVGGAKSGGPETIAATSRTGAHPYTTTFTGNVQMDPGLYWVTFTYNDGTAAVGASTKYVEIIKNVTTSVSGTLDANKWVATSFTVKGVKTIECEASITDDDGKVDQGDDVEIIILADIKENNASTGDDIKYYFCDGDNAPVEITDDLEEGTGDNEGKLVYTWDTDAVAKGNYYINIIVTDATGKLATGAETPIALTIK